jgi:hypothetical protein
MRVRNKGLEAATLLSILGFTLVLGITAMEQKRGDEMYLPYQGGIFPSAYVAIEDFSSYPVNQEIHLRSGPLGAWEAYFSSGDCKVYNDGGNLVLQQNQTNAVGGPTTSQLTYSTPGSPNGLDTVSWRQKISGLIGTHKLDVSFWEETNSRVTLFFNLNPGEVEYRTQESSYYFDAGLNCTNDDWETYEVLFYSTTEFMVRKDGGAWHGPLGNRGHFNNSSSQVTMMTFGMSTPNAYNVIFDDIRVSFLTTTPESPFLMFAVALLGIMSLVGILLFICIVSSKKKNILKKPTKDVLYRRPGY